MDNPLIKQQEEYDKIASLEDLIKSNPDPRELKRAIVVKMSIEGYEDIWLQGKNFLRKYWYLCKSFRAVQKLFDLFYDSSEFDFPKIHKYHFSQEINYDCYSG